MLDFGNIPTLKDWNWYIKNDHEACVRGKIYYIGSTNANGQKYQNGTEILTAPVIDMRNINDQVVISTQSKHIYILD